MSKAPEKLGLVYDFREKTQFGGGYKSTIVAYNHSPRYEVSKIEYNDGRVAYRCYAKVSRSGGVAQDVPDLKSALSAAKGYLSRVSEKDPNKTLWVL